MALNEGVPEEENWEVGSVATGGSVRNDFGFALKSLPQIVNDFCSFQRSPCPGAENVLWQFLSPVPPSGIRRHKC